MASGQSLVFFTDRKSMTLNIILWSPALLPGGIPQVPLSPQAPLRVHEPQRMRVLRVRREPGEGQS